MAKSITELGIQDLKDWAKTKLADKGVFNIRGFWKQLDKDRWMLRISNSVKKSTILRTLIDNQFLSELRLSFSSNQPPERWYLAANLNPYELLTLMRDKSYFIGEAALYLLGVIEKEPKYICARYIPETRGKSSKPEKPQLTQEMINHSFVESEWCAYQSGAFYQDKYLHLSRNSNLVPKSELVECKLPNSTRTALVVCLERAIIDVSLKPFIVGGVKEVINLYQMVSDKINVDKLLHTIYKLDFVYPYEQILGYYFDVSNACSKSDLKKFTVSGFDMYLDKKMINPNYSERWKVYFPSN